MKGKNDYQLLIAVTLEVLVGGGTEGVSEGVGVTLIQTLATTVVNHSKQAHLTKQTKYIMIHTVIFTITRKNIHVPGNC